MTLSPHHQLQLSLMQVFGDAIKWRTARMEAPCPACTPARRCDDHASDAALVESYRQHYEAVSGYGPGQLESALGATLRPVGPLGEQV